jgi:hypothetical protein
MPARPRPPPSPPHAAVPPAVQRLPSPALPSPPLPPPPKGTPSPLTCLRQLACARRRLPAPALHIRPRRPSPPLHHPRLAAQRRRLPVSVLAAAQAPAICHGVGAAVVAAALGAWDAGQGVAARAAARGRGGGRGVAGTELGPGCRGHSNRGAGGGGGRGVLRARREMELLAGGGGSACWTCHSKLQLTVQGLLAAAWHSAGVHLAGALHGGLRACSPGGGGGGGCG